MAIKQTVDLCPWADAVYGCDAAWWVHRKGLPEFDGLRMTWAENGLEGRPEILRVNVAKLERRQYRNDIVAGPIGTVGSGGNSGFQAVNLAIQFGARRIILIGFDMNGQSGIHWYGRNEWQGANNPTHANFTKWIAAFRAVREQLRKMGVEVVNASMGSAVDAFPKIRLQDALNRWLA